MNIAYISKISNERKNGLILFEKYKRANSEHSRRSASEEFDFYWKVSKFGNLGIIINSLNDKDIFL